MTPAEFHAQWMARLKNGRQLSDQEVVEIIDYRDCDAIVEVLIGEAACRGLFRGAQVDRLLDLLPRRFSGGGHACDQVLGLAILRDGARTPLSKIEQLLRMRCDWAATLAIADLGPFNCGEAFDAIRRSGRSDQVKGRLCAAVAAHQKSMWAEIKSLID